MSTDLHGLRPQDARARRDACQYVHDAVTGRGTHIPLGDPLYLSALIVALTALAAEGHIAAARLRGLDEAGALAVVTADFGRRIAEAQAVVAGRPG